MEPYEQDKMHVIERRHWWFWGKRRILLSALRRFSVAPHARILDVGCGGGALLELLRSSGYSAGRGVDVGEAALAFCRRRGCRVVCRGSADRLPFQDGSFDVLIAMDVIEHLDDDHAALREFRRVLSPSGRLFVGVPALNSLWSYHDEYLAHRRRYERAELCDRLREAGFAVQWATFTNFFIYPLVRLTRALRPDARESDVRPTREPLNTLMKGLYLIEPLLLRVGPLPVGTSLFAVASAAPAGTVPGASR